MKRKDVDTIFVDDTLRRKNILKFMCAILITLVIALVFLLVFAKRNKVQYAKYDESSNINYNVFLKKNEFFKNEFVTSDKQYISTLIDYISADFNYKLSLDNVKVNYKYNYKIVAEVNVKDKTSQKVIYNFKEDLVPEKSSTSDEKSLLLTEGVSIDYNKYNDLIKKFINIYDINDVVSTLDVNMYVNVVGSCDDLENNTNNGSVMTLSIPLTLKTMGIDISNDLINTKDNIMLCSKPSKLNLLLLGASITFALITLGIAVKLVDYSNKTKTAKSIYQKELKRILNNYSPYIQKVDGSFSLKGYQALTIDTFTDMLEIRDTLQQPILMVENVKQTGVFFIIPSNTKLLYVYAIRISDIEKDLKKQKAMELED